MDTTRSVGMSTCMNINMVDVGVSFRDLDKSDRKVEGNSSLFIHCNLSRSAVDVRE